MIGTAGVVAAANWNNLPGQGRGTANQLVDGDGEATGINVKWGVEKYNALIKKADRDSHSSLNPDTQNERLFEGYLSEDRRTLGVDLYNLGNFGTYDVYVYLDNDDGRGHDNHHGDLSVVNVSAGGTSYYVNDPHGNTFNGSFVDASSNNPFAPQQGNYVVFRGLTLDQISIRISEDETLGHKTGGLPSISGIQIVAGADRAIAVDPASGRIGGDFDADIVAGDNAVVRWFGGDVYEITTLGPVTALQADTIVTGEGADSAIGGYGDDSLAGGEGDDLLLGDNARIVLRDGKVVGLDDRRGGHDDDRDDDRHDDRRDDRHDDRRDDDDDDRHDDDDDDDDWKGKHFDPFNLPGIQLLDTANGGNDRLAGGGDDDLLYGQAGDDTYTFSGGGLGRDQLVESVTLNDRHDRLDFSAFIAGINLDLAKKGTQTINGGRFNGDVNLKLTLNSGQAFEDVTGSEFKDYIKGNDRDNLLIGLGGNDRLEGRNGDDVLLGMDGDDILIGGNGSDLLDGGDGNDVLKSGGHSVYRYWHWSKVDDSDILIGGAGNDLLIGDRGNDYLKGGRGADTLEGGTGSDKLKKDRSDKLVEQETQSGPLGLLEFFEVFSSEFNQDGFFFDDPTPGIPPAIDRPVRGWIDGYLSSFGVSR